jgi:hypothetical protein
MPVNIKDKWQKMPLLGETREGSLPRIDKCSLLGDSEKETVRIKDLVK